MKAVSPQHWQGLLRSVSINNSFQAARLRGADVPETIADLPSYILRLPFTTKAELSADQTAHPPYGSNLTFPLNHYTRCHQTSGTSGRPLRWLDTPESWDWMMENWQTIYRAAGVTRKIPSSSPSASDIHRVLARLRNCGPDGMSLPSRRRHEHGGPRSRHLGKPGDCRLLHATYAQHLAETAAAEGLDLTQSRVRTLVVAGEPGGSIPATRTRLEELWNGAQVRDHHGMTEVGPVTYECPARPGVLHVIETSYIAEIIDPSSLQPAVRGKAGELVLTTLGRIGSPLIRYRTGDLVQATATSPCPCGSHELALEGGIIGRTDDMVCVRGVNVYPSAIEAIVRGHGGVAEYQVHINRSGSMAEIELQVESAAESSKSASLAEELQQALQLALSLRIPVRLVAPSSLPRHEMKARRWIVK